MIKVTTEKLDEAVRAVRELPAAAQEAIAHELLERVSDYSSSHMNDDQRTEVKRRLAKARQHATDEEVQAVFHRYSPVV
jgi:t-SNARE complex subunit (syntaxin)